jgi:hypothetical protein
MVLVSAVLTLWRADGLPSIQILKFNNLKGKVARLQWRRVVAKSRGEDFVAKMSRRALLRNATSAAVNIVPIVDVGNEY